MFHTLKFTAVFFVIQMFGKILHGQGASAITDKITIKPGNVSGGVWYTSVSTSKH